MTTVRGVTMWVLLFLAGLTAAAANLGVWVERQVYDTDNFVSTVDRVLDDDDVQLALARTFTRELFEGADIEQRLAEALPEGLRFLALPLTEAISDFLTDAAKALLERQPFREARNEALRLLHEQLITIIDDEAGIFSNESGRLVLDLRPVLEALAEEIGLEDIEIAQGEGLLEGLELSEDAGRIEIQDQAVAWAYGIAKWGDTLVYVILGISVALFAVAIAVAPDRRRAVIYSGGALIVVATVSLVALVPIQPVVTSFTEQDDATRAVIRILTGDFKTQSLIIIGAGIGMIVPASLMGETRLALAVRGRFRRGASAAAGADLLAAIRERETVWRAGGLVTAAVLLVVWPDPSRRVYITVLALLAVYLLALAIAVGNARWSRQARGRLADLWARYVEPAGPAAGRGASFRDWVAARSVWLRLGGTALAALALILWPSLSFPSFILVAVLWLVFLAAVDVLASPPDRTPPAG